METVELKNLADGRTIIDLFGFRDRNELNCYVRDGVIRPLGKFSRIFIYDKEDVKRQWQAHLDATAAKGK